MLWPVGDAGGAEPAAEFLARLRERGYQDVVLSYLERLGSDPQCPPELKDALDYHLGVTLAAGLSRSASPAVQAAQLRKARGRLEKFLEEHPRQHPLTFEAKTRLARVLTDLGKLETEMAAAVEESSPQRGRLLGEARGCFQTAQQTLETMEKQLQDDRANYPPNLDEKDPRYPSAWDLDRELMELPLEIGGAIDGRAKTYRPADKEYRELLTAAAARYHRLYAKHPTFYGGIYARMCEGRVLAGAGPDQRGDRGIPRHLVPGERRRTTPRNPRPDAGPDAEDLLAPGGETLPRGPDPGRRLAEDGRPEPSSRRRRVWRSITWPVWPP